MIYANDNTPPKYGVTTQRSLGQYYTTSTIWLDPIVSDFIGIDFERVIDPFAGGGDLVKHFPNAIGYDIDPTLGWPLNDSLLGIPATRPGDLCITNPPYLAKNAATRLKLADAHRYYETGFNDLYEVGIDQCLRAFDKVVAIIPESFITTPRFKDRLTLVNIVEQPLFADTDCPVLVACWDKHESPDFRVFKNSAFVGWWRDIASTIPEPANDNMTFNDPNGGLGLIGFDSTKGKTIRFCHGREIDEVKQTSRSKTRISIPVPVTDNLIDDCNGILGHLRQKSADVVLSPFKGNTKTGERRRRLDFSTARKIIGLAIQNSKVRLAA